ncbi:type II toxin-antitoxin system prevent-host-death family antitoxin [Salinibacterium sp. ZJ454]|uniref:type II toxin-antitoxin system Phd/YefM family antitoxin n=1 Tax=Salinibacterium sp. ZJ454 TaxID=2708339 RepID=UPI001AB0313F|nr:type II toxin-antitoxin system prevent-host-death family antitoxin [Salinibacterium sp. ZJ454]
MSATEASRSFAALLDAAANGESVVITRDGRRIALLGPAAASNGTEFLSLLAGDAIDDRFAKDVARARDTATLGGPAWPVYRWQAGQK